MPIPTHVVRCDDDFYEDVLVYFPTDGECDMEGGCAGALTTSEDECTTLCVAHNRAAGYSDPEPLESA
jgi:hypothetical protein